MVAPGLIDQVAEDRQVDFKQWRANVVDLKRVMSVAKSVFLVLEHSNEACLRVAVEIVTDKVAKKTLWWNDNWLVEMDKYEYFKKIVHGKLGGVLTDVSGVKPMETEDAPQEAGPDVAELKARLEKAEASANAASLAKMSAENEAHAAKQQLDEVQTRVKDLETALNKMREEVREAQAAAEEAKKEAAEAAKKPAEPAAPPPPKPTGPPMTAEDKKKMEDLAKQVKELEDQKQAALEAQKKAQEEIKAAKAEAAAAKKEKEDAVKESAQERAKAAKAAVEAARAKKGDKPAKEEPGPMAEELGTAAFEAAQKESKRRIEELEQQLQQLQSGLGRSDEEVQQQLAQAQAEARAAQAEREKIEQQRNELEEQKAQLQQDHQQLQQVYQNLLDKQKNAAPQEKTVVVEKVAEPVVVEGGEELEATRVKLTEALHILEVERQKVQQQQEALAERQAEVTAAKEQAAAAKEEAGEAQKKLDKTLARIRELEVQVAEASTKGLEPKPKAKKEEVVEEEKPQKQKKEKDPELEELRAQAERVPILLEKLEKKREECKALREENEELEELKNKLSRILAQVRDQLKKVSEIAERKGCGDLIRDIMEESKVTETVSSPDFACFARLYQDALRRQAKFKKKGAGEDSEEDLGGPTFLKRRHPDRTTCPACAASFSKDGKVHEPGNMPREDSGRFGKSRADSPGPQGTGSARRPAPQTSQSREDSVSASDGRTSRPGSGGTGAHRRDSGNRDSGSGGYRVGYDEGYRAGIMTAKGLDGSEKAPGVKDPSPDTDGGNLGVTGTSLFVPRGASRMGSKTSSVAHREPSAPRTSFPSAGPRGDGGSSAGPRGGDGGEGDNSGSGGGAVQGGRRLSVASNASGPGGGRPGSRGGQPGQHQTGTAGIANRQGNAFLNNTAMSDSFSRRPGTGDRPPVPPTADGSSWISHQANQNTVQALPGQGGLDFTDPMGGTLDLRAPGPHQDSARSISGAESGQGSGSHPNSRPGSQPGSVPPQIGGRANINREPLNREAVDTAFDELDTNNDGFISRQEWHQAYSLEGVCGAPGAGRHPGGESSHGSGSRSGSGGPSHSGARTGSPVGTSQGQQFAETWPAGPGASGSRPGSRGKPGQQTGFASDGGQRFGNTAGGQGMGQQAWAGQQGQQQAGQGSNSGQGCGSGDQFGQGAGGFDDGGAAQPGPDGGCAARQGRQPDRCAERSGDGSGAWHGDGAGGGGAQGQQSPHGSQQRQHSAPASPTHGGGGPSARGAGSARGAWEQGGDGGARHDPQRVQQGHWTRDTQSTRYDPRDPRQSPYGQQGGHSSGGREEHPHSGRSRGGGQGQDGRAASSPGKRRKQGRQHDAQQKYDHESMDWRAGNHIDYLDIGLYVRGHGLFGDSSQDGYDSGGEHWRGGFKDGFVQAFQQSGPKAQQSPQFEVRGGYDSSASTAIEVEGSGRPVSQGSMGMVISSSSADDSSRPLSRSGSSPAIGRPSRQSGLQLSPDAQQWGPKVRRGVMSSGSAGELPQIGPGSKAERAHKGFTALSKAR